MAEKQVHTHTQITAGIKRNNLQAIIFNSRFKTPLNHVKDQHVFENKISNLKII